MIARAVNICTTGLRKRSFVEHSGTNCLESLGLASSGVRSLCMRSWCSTGLLPADWAGRGQLAASDQSGLTLIEAMVALAIFAIGSLGILSLFLGSFSMSAQNQNLTSGYEIAQSAVGVLRANGANALSYNGITVSATNPPSSTSALYPVAQVMSAYGMPPNAKVAFTVSSLNNGTTTCPCSATVSVTWGNGQTYTTQTIVGY